MDAAEGCLPGTRRPVRHGAAEQAFGVGDEIGDAEWSAGAFRQPQRREGALPSAGVALGGLQLVWKVDHPVEQRTDADEVIVLTRRMRPRA